MMCGVCSRVVCVCRQIACRLSLLLHFFFFRGTAVVAMPFLMEYQLGVFLMCRGCSAFTYFKHFAMRSCFWVGKLALHQFIYGYDCCKLLSFVYKGGRLDVTAYAMVGAKKQDACSASQKPAKQLV